MANASVPIVGVERMFAYESYDETWLLPIGFPLSLAAAAQLVVYSSALRHWCSGRPLLPSLLGARAADKAAPPPSRAVDALVSLPMLSETIFCVCCIVQCFINFGARAYVGGATACYVQGFYAAYYTFSSSGITGLVALAGAGVLARPGRVCWGVVLAAGVLVQLLSALIAALPLLGAGEYLFAKDYCMHDVESPMYGALFLVWWSASFLAVLGAVAVSTSARTRLSPAARALLRGIAAYYAIAWLPSVLIVLVWLGRGSVAAETEGVVGLYGCQAIFLHLNQLAVPLLFGWRLREHMNAAVAAGEHLAVGRLAPDAQPPPSPLPSPPRTV